VMSNHGPVRLGPDLMERAAREAKRQHRSTRKQIEFWVDLGRAVEGVVTREQVAGLRSGLMAVSASYAGPVDADEVFAELESRRPALAGQVTRARLRFQASRAYPGLPEHVDPDGRLTFGQFDQGEFQAIPAPSCARR